MSAKEVIQEYLACSDNGDENGHIADLFVPPQVCEQDEGNGGCIDKYRLATAEGIALQCGRNKRHCLENPYPDHEESAGQPPQQKQCGTPVVAVKGVE